VGVEDLEQILGAPDARALNVLALLLVEIGLKQQVGTSR